MTSAFHEIERKTYEPADFQVEDLEFLKERMLDEGNSANWSEMGAYKTTTVEWLIGAVKKALGDDHPMRVLIVTTKSGKGTYFQTLPHVLPEFTVLNANSTRINLLVNGVEFKYSWPEFDTPTVVIAHYNLFTQRKKKDPTKVLKETVLDKILDTKWDFVVLDEAHRIKSKDTGWTKNIKKLKSTFRHVMTGTGFINDPSEIWSLLNFLDKRTFTSYWKFREVFAKKRLRTKGTVRS
jgi:SNF2 family DNA or RNA helicase